MSSDLFSGVKKEIYSIRQMVRYRDAGKDRSAKRKNKFILRIL